MKLNGCLVAVIWILLAAEGMARCPDESAGQCSTSRTDDRDDDSQVQSFCSMSCDFQTDLCGFRQGCKDDGMTEWKAANGSAQADQTNAYACGRQSFSILESGWVNFSATLTCLQLTFTRHLPYNLDVFLVSTSNDSDEHHVHTLLNRTEGPDTDTEGTFEFSFTISQIVGKLLFRLYGGGGDSHEGGGERRLLRLHSVSLLEGGCHPAECVNGTFLTSDTCGWENTHWMSSLEANGSPDDVQFHVNVSSEVATLTTGLTRAPGTGQTDCWTFRYLLTDTGAGLATSRLNVSLLLSEGPPVLLWTTVGAGAGTAGGTGAGGDTWRQASVPVAVQAPYKIVFAGLKSDMQDAIAISGVKVTSDSSCGTFPQDASTDDAIPTDVSTTCFPSNKTGKETTISSPLPTPVSTLESSPTLANSNSAMSMSWVPSTSSLPTTPVFHPTLTRTDATAISPSALIPEPPLTSNTARLMSWEISNSYLPTTAVFPPPMTTTTLFSSFTSISGPYHTSLNSNTSVWMSLVVQESYLPTTAVFPPAVTGTPARPPSPSASILEPSLTPTTALGMSWEISNSYLSTTAVFPPALTRTAVGASSASASILEPSLTSTTALGMSWETSDIHLPTTAVFPPALTRTAAGHPSPSVSILEPSRTSTTALWMSWVASHSYLSTTAVFPPALTRTAVGASSTSSSIPEPPATSAVHTSPLWTSEATANSPLPTITALPAEATVTDSPLQSSHVLQPSVTVSMPSAFIWTSTTPSPSLSPTLIVFPTATTATDSDLYPALSFSSPMVSMWTTTASSYPPTILTVRPSPPLSPPSTLDSALQSSGTSFDPATVPPATTISTPTAVAATATTLSPAVAPTTTVTPTEAISITPSSCTSCQLSSTPVPDLPTATPAAAGSRYGNDGPTTDAIAAIVVGVVAVCGIIVGGILCRQRYRKKHRYRIHKEVRDDATVMTTQKFHSSDNHGFS